MTRHLIMRAIAAAFLLGTVAVSALADAAADLDRPTIANDKVEIQFDPDSGSMRSLMDRRNGHNFIEQTNRRPLWTIFLRDAATTAVSPSDASIFRWKSAREQMELTWEIAGEVGLRVTAIVGLKNGHPASEWRIRVEGLADREIESIRFPIVGSIARQDDESMAIPVWMGEAARTPRAALKGRRREWEYPGSLSLQCVAYYRQGGPGLYVSSDDTSALGKRFAVEGSEEGELALEAIHVPNERDIRDGVYETPYDVEVHLFEGDWFTAAESYRDWALLQQWAEDSRLANGSVPGWVSNTGLWVWNRGRSQGVLEPAAALQEAVGLPVSVFWHWWHGCAYDVGFPEYFPPREGAASFVNAMNAAHERGLHGIVYMNQRLWGMTTESWTAENAERFAVKGPNGAIRPEVYNTFTKSPCVAMCMGTSFWRDKYASLATTASRDYGVDGIYMDQACLSLPCYDAAHGHPLGGGNYWIDGFRSLTRDIRGKNDGIALAGEGCGEPWLAYLDLMLTLQVSKERYSGPNDWEPIPFFQAVYGGKAIFYGNYSSLTMPPYDELWPGEFAPKEPLKLLDRKFSTQFRLEQARAFAWGLQPTIANFQPEHLKERESEMRFVIKLARLRRKALKYLQYGTMLRPPVIASPRIEFDLSRLSIYAGQQEGLKEFRASHPAVLASAWRAADGSVGIVLVNVSAEDQTLTLNLESADYSLPRNPRVFRLTETDRTPVLGGGDGWRRVEMSVPKEDAQIYEVVPE